MQKRIETRILTHKGKEVEAYVPQIDIGNGFKDVLPSGSYILKESFDPVDVCKKCGGDGCADCNKCGFRKGEPVDNIHVANFFLDNDFKKLIEAKEILKKYE